MAISMAAAVVVPSVLKANSPYLFAFRKIDKALNLIFGV